MNAPPAEAGIELSTLLASSIHDMKNSLGLVVQTVEMLEDDIDAAPEARRERYRRLHHEALRLNAQMLQMLTLYKLQQEVYTLDSVETVVAELLEECALEHAPVLSARGIGIDWDCDPDLVGFFDRDLVAGILGNALNNAQRFARGRVRLTAAPWVHAAGRGVELRVEDDGPGFAPGKLAALARGEFHAGTAAGDTGLGLLFSSRVAQRHCNRGQCGHIACDNDGALGGGCLHIFLP